MERPGEYLRRERELRGVAFDDVCAALKLSKKKIKALEEDDYANLPHSAYVKGFIKSYCRYLGLDEGDAVLRYEVYLRDLREREDAKAAKEGEARPEKIIGAETRAQSRGPGRIGFAVDRTLVISVVILAAFIGIAAYAVLSMGGKATEPKTAVETKKDDTAAEPAAADTALKEPGQQPKAEVKEQPKAAIEEKKPVVGAHTLELAAISDVWVKVEAEGRDTREMTLRKGERKKLDPAAAFLLTIGNAGNLELIVDGKSEGLGGASGRVVKVKISGGEVVRTQLEVKKKTDTAAPAIAPVAPVSAPAAPQNGGGAAETKNTDTKNTEIKSE